MARSYRDELNEIQATRALSREYQDLEGSLDAVVAQESRHNKMMKANEVARNRAISAIDSTGKSQAQLQREVDGVNKRFDTQKDKLLRLNKTFTDSATTGSERLSRSISMQELSWRNVTEAIGNAVLKVGLWIVATTAVLGTVKKIQEVVQLWKDLEVTLERIGITASATGQSLFNYFSQAADVAIQMGMPIEQVMGGMDLALRATASMTDETKRAATAQSLLRDASILGNIAGMQFSQSIDILVGSLRQTGQQLDQGIKLLDKWVAVQKNASVSVNDLSQGFAIMADAGRAAGLTVDQINGLIAALSETVTLGPVETGNAIRALMSTLYNEGSIKLLQKYGVSVRDTNGEVRSFWTVMSQLSAMKKADVLDESVWLEIAKAAGAGQRRYAQFLALLNNFDTATNVATISANANGEALDANARIVDTLTNSWDQFTAAQNKLWYTFGAKSGLIDEMTGAMQNFAGAIDSLTNMNSALFKTVKVIGELTLAVIALKIASVALSRVPLPASMTAFGASVGTQMTALRTRAAFMTAPVGGGMLPALFGAGAYKGIQAGRQPLPPSTAYQYGEVGTPGFAGGGMLPPGAYVAPGGGAVPTVQTVSRWNLANMAWKDLGKKVTDTAKSATRSIQPYVGAGTYMREGVPYGVGQTAAGVTSVSRMQMAGMAWGGLAGGVRQSAATFVSRVRTGMQQPMGTFGLMFGTIAAATISKELYGSNWAMMGGGIGAGLGGFLGGPAGLAVGGLFGGLIGQAIADTFVTEADRIKKIFEDITKEFGLNADKLTSIYDAMTAAIDEEAAMREAAAAAAPDMGASRIAQQQGILDRLYNPGVAKYASPVGGVSDFLMRNFWENNVGLGITTGGTGLAAKYGLKALGIEYNPEGATGEGDWAEGLGALQDVQAAFAAGIISAEEYGDVVKRDYINWAALDSVQKAWIVTNNLARESSGAMAAEARRQADALKVLADEQRALSTINNDFTIDQQRITEIMDDLQLKQWEDAKIKELLRNQTHMTAEAYDNFYDSIVGISYGYASHIAAIEKINEQVGSLDGTLQNIDDDKWLLIQRWDPSLSTKIVEASTSVMDLSKNIELFGAKWQGLATLAQLPGLGALTSLNETNINRVQEALENLQETTGDAAKAQEYADAISQIQQYLQNIAQLDIDTSTLQALLETGANFTPETEVRLVGAEELEALREGRWQMPQFTSLAESLGKLERTFVTYIDPLTGDTEVFYDENTLALEMLTQATEENTDAIQKLEVEYNMPGWYQTPNRYWAMKETGGGGGFGPAQENMWADWIEYLQNNKSYAVGGTIPETGPYYLHKGETVLTPNSSGSDAALQQSNSIALVSQSYLSSINIGITSLRNEIKALRSVIANFGGGDRGASEFNKVTTANQIGISSLGVRRR